MTSVAGLGLVALLVALPLTVAGCSGDSSSASSAGGVAVGGVPAAKPVTEPQPAAGFSTATKDQAAGRATSASAVIPGLAGRSIIRTAVISVRVKDVLRASAEAESLAAAAGGFVAGEQTQARPDAPRDASAVITLRVPSTGLSQLLSGLGRLGSLLSENQSSSDVTGDVIDLNARIQSQQASVDRIRTLLVKATTIGQVVEIESELANREGALESLKGQAKALADQTSLATVTVTLAGPGAVTPTPVRASTGFGHGLSAGWKAFTSAATWLLTAIGAVLPFLILAVPLAWAVVVMRRRRPAGQFTAPEPAVSSPAP